MRKDFALGGRGIIQAGRWGHREHDDASFITATDLAVDGGYDGLGKTTAIEGSK